MLHVATSAEDRDVVGGVIEGVAVDVMPLSTVCAASGAFIGRESSQRPRPSSALTGLISRPGMVIRAVALALLYVFCALFVSWFWTRTTNGHILATLAGTYTGG